MQEAWHDGGHEGFFSTLRLWLPVLVCRERERVRVHLRVRACIEGGGGGKRRGNGCVGVGVGVGVGVCRTALLLPHAAPSSRLS